MRPLKTLAPVLLMTVPVSLAWDVVPRETGSAQLLARAEFWDEVIGTVIREIIDAVTGAIIRYIEKKIRRHWKFPRVRTTLLTITATPGGTETAAETEYEESTEIVTETETQTLPATSTNAATPT
ncbi:hypothetical protein NW759_009566 [Fusarium solani]|nr:hypothetical protein NW759_009566 [Fusarium solani]